MKKSKKIGKSLILPALTALAFGAVAAGTTYALFTSQSETNVAVTSGKVSVAATVSDLVTYSGEANSLTGNPDADADHIKPTAELGGVNGTFINGGTAVIDSEIGDLKLTNVTPGDKVTFKITVHNASTVNVKYRTRVIASEDSGLYEALSMQIGDYTSMGITDWEELGTDDKVLSCTVALPTSASDEYQGNSCNLKFAVEAVQGNAYTTNDTAYYTLSQFNKLDAIPEGVKNVYLSIGSVSLKDSSVIIGNDNLRDKYERDGSGGNTYTDKDGINLVILGGTIKDGPAASPSVTNMVCFRIPNKSTVTFDGTKIKGFFGLSGATTDNTYGSVLTHAIAGVTFDNCTFDALWLQNGGFATNEISFKGCTFNKIENSVYASTTNPMWFKNIGQGKGTNVSIDGCTFNTNRPVKIVEETLSGQTISVTNCTFNMEDDAEYKNAALMFSSTSDTSTLGNVVISGNTVNNGVALLTFYNPPKITMADGATFTVKGNTLNDGAKLSVKWKSATEFTPDFLVVA